MITKKLLENTIEYWDRECPKIMESQKKYNEEALKWCKERLGKWIEEIE